MIPSIPSLLTFPIVKGILDKMRLALNVLTDAALLALQNRAYRFRINVVNGHLWVEVAKRSTTPGQEIWTGYFDFGALPP